MRLLAGQVAVVTGAASGIGFALAQQLGERGLRLVLADVRGAAAKKACARLPGVEALSLEVDVADPDAVDALFASVVQRFDRVDLICNNAGIVPARMPSWEQPVTSWRWTLDVMLMGVVHGIRSFVPALIAQGSGHVLNTASMGGLVPLPGLAPYAAVKSAVVSLTETLAQELQGTGVGATVLCPGFVPSELARSTRENRPRGVEMPLPAVDGPPPASTGETADDVARAALVGIESQALHVVVAAGSAQAARERVARLLDDLPGDG